MSNKLYNILKWAGLIALPAIATFCGTVLPLYNVENTEAIVTTITALGVLIGALVGVSTVNYNKASDVEGGQTESYIENEEE